MTVGLAVSVGGLCGPLLGVLADATSLRLTLTALLALPVLALLLAARLHDPGSRSRLLARLPGVRGALDDTLALIRSLLPEEPATAAAGSGSSATSRRQRS